MHMVLRSVGAFLYICDWTENDYFHMYLTFIFCTKCALCTCTCNLASDSSINASASRITLWDILTPLHLLLPFFFSWHQWIQTHTIISTCRSQNPMVERRCQHQFPSPLLGHRNKEIETSFCPFQSPKQLTKK